jgi:hypothetical protein
MRETGEICHLIANKKSAVRRQIDRSIADKLRRELLDSDPPFISAATMGQLAKCCNTNNPAVLGTAWISRAR